MSLSVSGLPAGVTATFDPAVATPAGSSVLTLAADRTTPTGSSKLTITGANGSSSDTQTVLLRIAPSADFNIAARSASATIPPGGTASYSLRVDATEGFSGNIVFSATGLPAGGVVSFDPKELNGPGMVTMAVTTPKTFGTGSSSITVKAVSGLVNHTATVALKADAASSFSQTAIAASHTVSPGGRTEYSLVIAPSGGFDGRVSYSVTGLPPGAKAAFTPTGQGKTTLVVTTADPTAGGSYGLVVTAASGNLARNIPLTLVVSAPDFFLTGIPASRRIKAGNTITHVLTVGALDGFKGNVDLAISGLPKGATASFSPASVKGGGTSTLTVNTTSATPVGSSQLKVSGTSGTVTHSSFAALTVGSPDFDLSLTPNLKTIFAGTQAVYTVSVNPTNGFTDPVTFSIPGLPAFVTASFSSPTLTGAGTTTLTLSSTSSVTLATYVLTLNATSATVSHTAPVTLITSGQPNPDFSITPSTSAPLVYFGSTTQVNFTIAALQTFNGQVNLSYSSLPAGLTAALSQTSITASGSFSLTIAAGGALAGGAYPIVVTGVSGGLTNSATLTLNVLGPAPSPWMDTAIGAVNPAGIAGYNSAGGTIQVLGSGTSLNSNFFNFYGPDSVHFLYQPLNGDGAIVARVVSATSSYSGVMIRERLDAGSANLFLGLNDLVPNRLEVSYRTAALTAGSSVVVSNISQPYWIKLVRQGNTITTSSSPDGLAWTPASPAVTLNMQPNVLIGLAAVSSANTAVFDNVTVSGQQDFLLTVSPTAAIVGSSIAYPVNVDALSGFGAAVTLAAAGGPSGATFAFSANSISGGGNSTLTVTVPGGTTSGSYPVTITGTSGSLVHTTVVNLMAGPAGSGPWSNVDIGPYPLPGSTTLSGSTFTVTGYETNIANGLQFAYVPLPVDGTIIARIATVQSSDQNAKVGVMIRQSLDATSPYAVMELVPVPGNQLAFLEYRQATGSAPGAVQGPNSGAPYWVKLTKSGTLMSGSLSPDGSTWTPVGTATVSISGLCYIGLAVSSNNGGTISATFDNVSITAAQDFSLTASPTVALSGGNLNLGIGVVPAGGFTGGVTLSVAGIPSGASSTFTPGTITGGNGSSTLAVTPGTAAAGKYLLTVTGTSGALIHTAVTYLTIGNPIVSPWTAQDIGTTGTLGSANFDGTTFTVRGAGSGIDYSYLGQYSPDSFHYVYQTLNGDGAIVARMVTAQNGETGLMIRQNSDPGSMNVFVGMVNTTTPYVLTRLSTAAGGGFVAAPNATLPQWFKLQRQGNTITGFISADGITWTVVGAPVTAAMSPVVSIGLVSTSQNPGAVGTTTFDNVSVVSGQDFLLSVLPPAAISGSSISYTVNVEALTGFSGTVVLSAASSLSGATSTFTPLPLTGGGVSTLTFTVPAGSASGSYALTITATSGSLAHTAVVNVIVGPAGTGLWTNADVGAPSLSGQATFSSNTFTVSGGGNDIVSGTPADQFQFVYRPLSGDGTIVARVVSMSNQSARAGALIRESLAPTAPAAFAEMSDSSSSFFQYRLTAPSTGTYSNGPNPISAPYWMKLVRAGNTFTASTSPDGSAWTQIGSPVTIAMAANVFAGLAIASTTGPLKTASFDNVSITGVSDFSISATPAVRGVTPGGPAAAFTVSVNTLGGLSGVALGVTGLPAGASAAFGPASINTSASSVLTIVASTSTPAGTYPLTITGISGAITHTAAVSLTVGSSPTFTVSVTPATRTVAPGSSATYTLSIVPVLGFSGTVSFSASGLPNLAGVSFNPATVTGSGNTTMTVSTQGASPLGTSTINIAAVSGTISLSPAATVTLTLSNTPDFSLTSTVTSRTITPGSASSIPVTVVPTGGFNGVVALDVTGLPSGANATFSPASITNSGTSVLTITTTAATPIAAFAPTIRGTSGSLVRTFTPLFTVTPAADYSLSTTPTSRTVNAGNSATYTITVNPLSGFSGDVTFSAAGLPSGVTASFNPATVSGGAGTTTLTVTTAANVNTVTVNFDVTGTSGTVSRVLTPVTLLVNGTPNFAFSLTSNSQPIAPGQSVDSTFSVIPLSGFTGVVSFSATGGPAGSTYTFTPTTVTTDGAVTMKTAIPSNAATQTYLLTVTATSGSLTHTATVSLTVNTSSSYEAEAAGNTRTLGASVAACAPCSGANRVDNLGFTNASANGTLTFNGVTAANAGTYLMTIYYSNGDTVARTASISVNGSTTSLSFTGAVTGSYNTVASVTRYVTLNAGSNTIKFFNNISKAPALDRITLINTASCVAGPGDVMLVIDRSGSVGGLPFTDAKNAAKQFVDDMHLVTDQIGLASFTNVATTDQTLTHTGSTVKTKIDALVSGGSTFIGSGITAAKNELTSARHNAAASQTIVLLSDGIDNPVTPNTAAAADAAKAAGIRIITISYGSGANVNTAVMTALASSAADYHAAPTAADVYLAYASIAQSICRTANQAPTVSAGSNQTVTLPAGITLAGTYSDDGYPDPGVPVATWSKVSGPGTVTFGNVNVPTTGATFSAAGTYVLQLSVSDSALTTNATVTITVNAAGSNPNATLVLSPGSSGPNIAGALQTQVVNALLATTTGTPIPSTTVLFTVTGAHPSTGSVSTNVNGIATYTVTGATKGNDAVTATATYNSAPVQSNAATIGWITPTAAVSMTTVKGQYFTNDTYGLFSGAGFVEVPSQQPVFEQYFPSMTFNPRGAIVIGNLRTVYTSPPWQNLTTDLNGNLTGTIFAQGNGFRVGSPGLPAFAGVFTGGLAIAAAGNYTIRTYHDDGMLFGIGGGATRVSAGSTALYGSPASGVTPFKGYAIMSADNPVTNHATDTVVNFPAPGVYPFEFDLAAVFNPDWEGTMTTITGGVEKVIPPAGYLALTPNALSSQTVGATLPFTVTVVDSSGQAVANAPVTLNINGLHARQLTATTNASGVATFSYTGTLAGGGDTVQATAGINGMTGYSNAVEVSWNTGTNVAPVVNAGLAQNVVLPGGASLVGLATDDGLPLNGTLVINWTKVSGPGNVAFKNLHAPLTSATFDAPGTYVLQLSGFDGLLTTNSTVTITVTGNTNPTPGPPSPTVVTQGWIGGLTYGSTLTGLVPITVAGGNTLTSGTLTYYPVLNGANITMLNANTTGSGALGTLDTTVLPNGSYWVQLTATNTSAVTLTSVALITVAGDYKPGRVMASVTDLVVPAAGLPINITRTYDSLERGKSSDFGFGWSLTTNVKLEVGPTDGVTLTINNQRRTFYFTPVGNGVFTYFYSPLYTAEPGMFGSLTTTGDSCSGVLVRSGNLYRCGVDPLTVYAPTGFVYTDPYGRVYTVGSDSSLKSIRDLNGNTITITAAGITSSAGGLTVPFVRDAQGRITKITDPLGNSWNYGYNGAGELSSVTLPPVPGVTAVPIAYTYNAGHLLAQETDARGNVAGSTTYYADGRLHTVTDGVSNTISYAYNTATNTTTISNPDTGTETIQYDSYGKMLNRTDGINRTTVYTYDTKHNLITERNPLLKTTTYGYDANGFKTTTQDSLNHTTTVVNNAFGGPTSITNALTQATNITYDASFNIAGITDSIGPIRAFTWNPAGLPLTETDARGNASSNQYDQYGNKTASTDALNRTTNTVYNTLGQMTSQTDPRGNTTTYTYDPFSRAKTKTDALNHTMTYVYDAVGNKLSETDANNHTTSFVYDAENRLTQVNYPDTTSVSYTYDFRGKQLTMTDQLSRVTKSVYDKAGQLTSTIYAFGTADAGTVSYTYDGAGRKLTETDERGNTTTNGYDAAGRMVTVTNMQGKVTTYGYDNANRRTWMLDANNHLTQYVVDARGRRTSVIDPNNKTATSAYDGMGLVTSMTDQENRTTAYTYDKASQLTSVVDALSRLTQYAYDPAGNKTSQTDTANHSTFYTYDAANRRTRRTLPTGVFETYAYDPANNMASRTNFNGKTTAYGYDTLNRQTSRTPDASLTGQTAVTTTYTATGKRKTMADASGTTTWNYDNRDRVLSKATPQGTLTYTLDAHSNVASVLSSNTNGVSVAYGYDSLNRLSGVTDNRLSNQTTYTYDNVNNLASFTYPNGVLHSYTYDPKDQLSGLQVGKVPGVFANYTQTFGDAGHKSTVAELGGRAMSYGYDNTYRLLSETISGDPVSANNGALNYVLDAAANRQSRTSTLVALAAQSFTFDANDRLNSDTYDNNGNTLASGGNSYAYEFEDRLTAFNAGAVMMVYDGDGNRVSKTAGGVTTLYLVDDFTPTGYPQVAEEIVAGAVQRRYTHGTMRISQTAGSVTSYYGYDGGGSVRTLADTTGVVTDTYAYDAFGNLVASTGTTSNLYLYRAEQFDPVMGLYYLRARWMNPQTGRFLTQDKYEASNGCGCCASHTCGSSKNPIASHRFLFADADPVNNTDPSGLNTMIEYVRINATIFVAVVATVEAQTHALGKTLYAVAKETECVANFVKCTDFNPTPYGPRGPRGGRPRPRFPAREVPCDDCLRQCTANALNPEFLGDPWDYSRCPLE